MQEKTIYALGFFDGVHLGHQALLNTCKALAAEYGCAAGVQTFGNHPDALVEGKAPGLINSIADREALLRGMGMERVIVLPFDNALMHTPWQDYFQRLLTEFHAGGIVCGYDFRFGDRGAGDGEKLLSACKEAGIPCRVVPEQKVEGLTVSSTRIRGFLADGNIAEANRFLGHPHGEYCRACRGGLAEKRRVRLQGPGGRGSLPGGDEHRPAAHGGGPSCDRGALASGLRWGPVRPGADPALLRLSPGGAKIPGSGCAAGGDPEKCRPDPEIL